MKKNPNTNINYHPVQSARDTPIQSFPAVRDTARTSLKTPRGAAGRQEGSFYITFSWR